MSPSLPYILSPTGREGVRLFNEQAYYRCHDAFEAVWIKTAGAERHYYQGLIQIAVAFYKIREEKNWRGATSLLTTGIGHLKCVDPGDVELNIERLVQESQAILEVLNAIGAERISEISSSMLPKLHYLPEAESEPWKAE
ncbi:MAG: DUF309 domain-containing protein [Nitrospinae bacterium]|nr:DUF309 domain-containing protein [Nitrospinota bacterium]